MKYAIIDGSDVINSIDYNEQPEHPLPGFPETIIAVQDDFAAPGWKYIDGQFIAPDLPTPTPEQLVLKCQAEAAGLLSATDWTSFPDVADPTKSNPYLLNQDEFTAYRSIIRNYAVNPVTNPTFPIKPTEQWSS